MDKKRLKRGVVPLTSEPQRVSEVGFFFGRALDSSLPVSMCRRVVCEKTPASEISPERRGEI